MARSVGFSVVRREASPVPLRPCAPAPLRPAPLCSHVPAAPLPLTRSAPAAPSPGCGRPRCAERRAPRAAPGVHRPALHHGGDQGRRRRPPLPPERRVRAARHPHVTHACAVRGRGEVQWASASEAYSPRCSGTLHSTAPYAHTNPTRAMQCSAAAAGWRALDGEGPPQPAHASSSASSSISLRCCSLMPAGGRVREVRVSRRRDGTRVGGGRARVGRSWQHTQESQSWCSGRGRRAQGAGWHPQQRPAPRPARGWAWPPARQGTRAKAPRTRPRPSSAARADPSALHVATESNRGRCSKQVSGPNGCRGADALICKNNESKQRVGAAPSRRARSARAPRARAPARRRRGRPPRPAGGSAEGALSVGRSEESGRRRPVLSNARCGGEVALHAALNRGHCPMRLRNHFQTTFKIN